MLIGWVQYQGKAGFSQLNFQFSISQNTGKCELGRFLLRQLHLFIFHSLWHESASGKNNLPLHYHNYALDNSFSNSCTGKSQPKNTLISLNVKPSGWLELVHSKNNALINDDVSCAFICICPFTWHNKYKLLQFIDTSLALSHHFVHR